MDGSVKHIKASDFGGSAYFENDFGFGKNGVIGGRVEYQHFLDGSPVLAVGLHLGFTF
ncbi:hypothetical protein [Pontibacter harenae]|uniref:hypothetical protein n=1 Tax=Pontibacter harenae TaxID=2894083 RepID=UPI001E31F452|nr:hypothetical protein [Pontibacter harenae]MCC9165688.1 hypothetical protein [Pontibacter harenae]